MNHDIAIRWADACTSGEYAHGFSALRRDECYCPLGILVDLYHQETGNGEWLNNPMDHFHENGDVFGATLPPRVRTWAEFVGENTPWTPRLPERFTGRYADDCWDGSTGNFITVNDRLNLTLAEIAEIIHQQWELI